MVMADEPHPPRGGASTSPQPSTSASAAVGLTTARLRRMVDVSPNGVLLADEAGSILFVNPRTASLFGFSSADDIVGVTVEDMILGGYAAIHRARARQVWGRRRDGSLFPVEVSVMEVSDDDGFAVIAILRDISYQVALESLRHDDRSRLSIAQERERMNRDLHDIVIQRLFATGMGLHTIIAKVDDDAIRTKLELILDQVETTIREIRTAIAGVSVVDRSRPFESLLTDAIEAWSSQLGFTPTVALVGDLSSLPAAALEEMVPSLTEALANVVRHAAATSVLITITGAPDRLSLVVADDGVGFHVDAAHGLGLDNLCARAKRLGGTCAHETNESGGTTVVWQVPLGR